VDSEGESDHEIERCIRLASASLSQLNKSLWKCQSTSLTTKIRVYETIVRRKLLYRCETRVLEAKNSSKLNVFDHDSLQVFYMSSAKNEYLTKTSVSAIRKVPNVRNCKETTASVVRPLSMPICLQMHL
jgi:hypothetical protein